MIKILIALLCISIHVQSKEFKYELSICAIFQNEAPYLKEWIDYHQSVGVEHFYLYNNNSSDHYLSILYPYIERQMVTLVEWPSDKNDWDNFCFKIQPNSYTHAVEICKKTSKWLAVIDTDEFIIPVCENTILQVLDKHFWFCSAICINWQCYGTSHIWEFPENKMLENLTMKMRWNNDWNKHCKTIVNPRHVSHFVHPHACYCSENHWCVDTHFNPCSGISNEIYIDRLRINHYWTRDEKYFNENKIPRYIKWDENNKSKDLIDKAKCMNEEYDPILSGI